MRSRRAAPGSAVLSEAPVAGLRQRVLTLRSFDGLGRLDIDALTLIAEYARYRRYPAGAAVLREQQRIESIHLVVDGVLEVERRRVHIAEIGRGETAGILSVLAHDDNGVRAVARRETCTLEVPVDVFLAAYEENFSLVRNSLRLSASTLLDRRHELPAAAGDDTPALGARRERAMTLAEHVIELRKNPLFGASNVDATLELARHLQPIRLQPGERLWEIGDTSSYSLRVDYGRVRCRNAGGEESVVGGGFVLGLLPALADRPRGFSAVAETEVFGYRNDLETFLAVLESHFPLGMDLLEAFSRSLLGIGEATEPTVAEATAAGSAALEGAGRAERRQG